MLNIIIPYIDQSLTEFKLNYGLAELVTEVRREGDDPRTFPAVYSNSEDYTQIDLEKYISYHRVNGELTIQETDQNTRGCTHGLDITYPMFLVGMLPRSAECDQYATDTIANGVASKLKQISFPKPIKALVKSWSIEIIIRAINTNREEIWSREYKNIAMQANFGMAYFSISYEILIKADSGCLNLLDCSEPVVFPPTCSQISIIPNERLKCLTQEQIEYIAANLFTIAPVNIVAPLIGAENFDYGSTLTVIPGEWVGTGVTLSYQWYRDGSAILGATGTTYVLGISDTSETEITVMETATNFYGSTDKSSLSISPTLLPATADHYQRVIADSGILSSLSNLNTLFVDGHFANDLVCAFDPGTFGYKLNSTKVSKVYSIDSSSDISQPTSGEQPLLLNPTSGRYARVAVDNIEANISVLSPVYNSQGPQVLQVKMSTITGSYGVALYSPPGTTSIAMQYISAGNQLTFIVGGAGFAVSLGSFVPASEFFIRGYYDGYPTYKIDVSNDGDTWINVHSASRTQASFTLTRYGIGKGTLTSGSPSSIYDAHLDRGVLTHSIDLDLFDPAVSSRQWTNSNGLQFNIAPITTGNGLYPSQIVTELTCAFDGVDDRMQASGISFPSGSLTIYAIIDWGMIQSGTRYCIDDSGENISIWTNGVDVFVGDSVNFINVGAKPTNVNMLTFVKDGENSLAQINQGAVVTGDAGATMPTGLIIGGKTGVSTNNSTFTRGKIYAFDGADDADVRLSTQNLLNSIQATPLF